MSALIDRSSSASPFESNRTTSIIEGMQAYWTILEASSTVRPEVVELLVAELEGDSDPTEDIEALYRELRELAAARKEQRDDLLFSKRLAELRALQEHEAACMRGFLDARRPLPRGAGDDALARADALIKKHEDPATAHPPSRQAD